jgi:uncharacterized membrane protein YciS (DUF1049 family)
MLLVFVLALVVLVLTVFLLGFRLGGDHWQAELTRVRLEAVRAERQLHDLTRQAFVAMAERAGQLRRPQ